MSRTLLVAGTASHVGKSTVAAGLCRLLADRGVAVTPYKAQNMSNNARVVVRPGEDAKTTDDGVAVEWGEIGVSQFVQSRAARTTPTTDVNPVLLKPRGDGESQLIVHGRAVADVPAGSYYEDRWEDARDAAIESYRRLARNYDVVIAEGAGSIAEINLHHRDLANVETARFGDAEILLVVDIERGGAFAGLYGTLELLPGDLRDRVIGAMITKFRGNTSLLEPGLRDLESRTGVPILGVIPYDDPGLPEEDSVGLPATDESTIRGANDGVPAERAITIAVPRLPRISNTTDVEALSAEPGVRVAYVSLEKAGVKPLGGVDAVVIPGTKNTVDDLQALRNSGFEDELSRFGGPIVGLCGGYQLLGERLTNAAREGTGTGEVIAGVGLLPVETRFESEKCLERTTVPIDSSASALLGDASGVASGYEIHAGRTTAVGDVGRPLGPTSAARGLVLGTYLHGVFDNRNVRDSFLDVIYSESEKRRPESVSVRGASGVTPYDHAAGLVREHVDLRPLGSPFC